MYLKSDEPMNDAVAFNWGAEASSGQFLAFMESGSVWRKEKLRAQAEYLTSSENNDVWIYTVAAEQTESGKRIPSQELPLYKTAGYIFPDLIMEEQIDISTVMMRRDVYLEMGGMNEELPVLAAYEFLLRLALLYPVSYFNLVLTLTPPRLNSDEVVIPVQALLLEEFSQELSRLGLKQEKLEKVIAYAEEKEKIPLFREYADILTEDTEYREYLQDFLERTDFEGKKPESVAQCVDGESEG